jgi:hypothetical protein
LIAFFWVLAPFSLVEVYQRFRGPCCFIVLTMEARLHGAKTQKTAIFVLTAVRTANPTTFISLKLDKLLGQHVSIIYNHLQAPIDILLLSDFDYSDDVPPKVGKQE